MIKIFYPEGCSNTAAWQEQLDRTPLQYQLIMDEHTTVPLLIDGDTRAEGVPAIDTYLAGQELFAKDWYEDRCDKYDFDPDAIPKIKGING